MRITEKIIWITGASSGIGEALSVQLNQAGATVILSARRKEELERVQKSLANPEKSHILPLDLAEHETFDEKVAYITEHFGRIDMLINNGGISQRSYVHDTDNTVDRKIMEINYFGTIFLSKSVLPALRASNGKYVVISSLSGKFGFFQRSAYSASKHALHGFFDSLRLEEESNGVSVLIVCPGKIRTDISKNALEGDGKKHAAMDPNQEEGMPADECAKKIIRGILKDKLEIVVGGKERHTILIKRLFPKLLQRILRKQRHA